MKKIESFAAYLCALIFFQTLFFKFTGAPESVWIFTKIGIEPWGRYASGVFELMAGVMLIVPRLRLLGATLAMGIMGGAIVSHLAILGIEVQGDGGFLFFLAVVSLLASGFIVLRNFNRVKVLSFLGALAILLPLTAIAKDFGIHGYDAVSYIDSNKAVEGKPEFKLTHGETTYLFSTEENLTKFKKSPEKYLPAYGGWCAYAMADGEKVEIDPKTFKVIDGKTYLFYNGIWGNTLPKWNKDEAGLKTKADKEWIKLNK